jgi:hypothetical protein
VDELLRRAGEHMDAFEEFETRSFVSRLLGKGDVKGLAKKISEAMPEAKQAELMEQMAKTGMTLRMFRTLLDQMGSLGPISSVRRRRCVFHNPESARCFRRCSSLCLRQRANKPLEKTPEPRADMRVLPLPSCMISARQLVRSLEPSSSYVSAWGDAVRWWCADGCRHADVSVTCMPVSHTLGYVKSLIVDIPGAPAVKCLLEMTKLRAVVVLNILASLQGSIQS